MSFKKYFLTIINIYLLCSCTTQRQLSNNSNVLCNCPSYIDYSEDFQKNLVRELDKLEPKNSYYINQVVIDWFNLNRKLKAIRN